MKRTKQVLVAFASIAMVGATAAAVPSTAVASPLAPARSMVLSAAAGSQWTVQHPFKAGFIYVGAPSDAGWTHAHDVGRLEVQKYFGGRVETMYKEDVPEGPQCAAGHHSAGRRGREHHLRNLVRLPA